jgi:hypothetical protein
MYTRIFMNVEETAIGLKAAAAYFNLLTGIHLEEPREQRAGSASRTQFIIIRYEARKDCFVLSQEETKRSRETHIQT